jgi:hypothetical protein
VITGLSITRANNEPVPAGGLRATTVRQIPVNVRVTTRTYADMIGMTYANAAARHATYADARESAQITNPDHKPRRGRKHSDEFLAVVADSWAAVLESDARDLYDALVDELARRGYAYGREGARELVRNARRRGLLQPPAFRGDTGGGLTAKARKLLAGRQGRAQRR